MLFGPLCFLNASNSRNVTWLLTVKDAMVYFVSLWSKYKNKWHFLLVLATFLAHFIPITLIPSYPVELKKSKNLVLLPEIKL